MKRLMVAMAAAVASGLAPTAAAQPTDPSAPTTVLVLRDGGRIYRVTAAYEYCDTVERFARTVVDRITT